MPQPLRSTFNPVKPRAYGAPKDVAGRAIAEAGGPKAVAARLGKALSMVHGYSDPACVTQMNYGQVCELTRQGARAFVEDLSAHAGGFFMPVEASADGVADLVSRSALEYGEFMSRTIAALVDRHISPRERENLLRDLDDVLRLLVQARAAIVAGPK